MVERRILPRHLSHNDNIVIPGGRPQADFVGTLEASLGPDYVRLRSDTLGQMRLVLFARLDVFPAVDGCASGLRCTLQSLRLRLSPVPRSLVSAVFEVRCAHSTLRLGAGV